MTEAQLPRILGTIFYDAIIVLAIIFVAAQWFPLIPERYQSTPGLILFKQAYILGIAFLYFAYSWRRGGQTIGMKSWRIQLINAQQNTTQINWRQCSVRYLVSILSWLVAGLGFLWIVFSPKHQSWHDLASDTRLIVLPKKQA